MIQEPSFQEDSSFHRMDPRLKVVFVTVYSFVVALCSRPLSLAAALSFAFVLTGLARLDPFSTSKRLLWINGLVVFLWVVLPLTYEGRTVVNLGPVPISLDGVRLCARITLKSNAIVLTLMSLIAPMSIPALGDALNRLRVPSKMIYLLLMTYRYLFVIDREYARLVKAARIRGFRPKTNLHTYKTYAYFIGTLFVRAAERAERVHQAMLCRGFSGHFYCLRELAFSMQDWIWSAVFVVFMAGMGMLEWTGLG